MEEEIFMTKKEINRVTTMKQLLEKRIKQREAAEALKLSIRQVQRLLKKYRKSGEFGLVSKKRGKPSNHRLPTHISEEITHLIYTLYCDFGPTLATEKLDENHGIKVSVESVRRIMIKAEIWKRRKPKKYVSHPMRDRRSRFGELVQIDGSPHAWFEDRAPKCTLLVFIDDATGKLVSLWFAKSETTQAYFSAIKHYLRKCGKPICLYSDRDSVFVVNHPNAEDKETQFGRAMRQLNIKMIQANTPQAKGRVERANQTLQDRLVKELRMENISDVDAANKFLVKYSKKFNLKFAVEPKLPEDAHRSLLKEDDLDKILCEHTTRVISKNLSFQYKGVLYQVTEDRPSYALRKARVRIIEKKAGEIIVEYNNKPLKCKSYNQIPYESSIVPSKEVNQRVDQILTTPKRGYKPSKNHPWRSRCL